MRKIFKRSATYPRLAGPVDFDDPAALSGKLAAGELDLALVSSFEFFRQPIYTIADRVALGSDGPVYSVILAHRGPLEDVGEIALDPASLTSVNLLRCLLAEKNLQPHLVAPSGDPAQARLLIGDPAIRFHERHADEFKIWDLGQAWKELTGLPFVFALWLIRPEVADAAAIADRLRERRDENFAALDQVVASQSEFGMEFCRRYFEEHLRFAFGERERQGLLHFRTLCQKYGLLPADATPLILA